MRPGLLHFRGDSDGAQVEEKGMQVSDVPRDASAIKTARSSALEALRSVKHIIVDTTKRDARRAARRRPDCYPFPDYR